MNKKVLLLLPALAMVLAGCNNTNPSSQPASSGDVDAVSAVEVTPAEKTLEAGETVQLEATVKPFTVENKAVTWSSDDEALATVNVSGLVTTLAAGTVHIKATSEADPTKFGQSTLTITPAYVYAPAPTPDLAATYKFGTYQVAVSKRIFFNGEFESYPRGKTVEGYENGVDVKFEEGPNAGEYYVKFTVGEATKYLGMGDNHRFGGFDSKSAETVWNWNNEYMTITRKLTDGKTYFPGTYNNYETISGCDISMVDNDYIFQFLTKIEPCDPTSVAIVEDTANVYANGSVQLHAKCEPAGAANAKLTWSVLDNEKVHVDNHGLVTADEDATVGSTATVKATWGELPGDSCVVTVKQELNYGTLENPLTVAQAKALIDLAKPTEQPLFVKGVVTSSGAYTTYNNWDPIWLASDDGSVEKAFEGYRLKDGSSDGSFKTTYKDANSLFGKTVTICGIGTTFNTTYETDGGDESKLLKVEDVQITPTGIFLTPSETFDLEAGAEKAISAKILPYGASANINWAVSPADKGVTFEDGKIKAADDAELGDYTLTAAIADTELSATISFTVIAGSGETVTDIGSLSYNKDTTVTVDSTSVEKTVFYTSTSGVNIKVEQGSSTSAVNVWKSDFSSCRWYKSHIVTLSHASSFNRIVLACDSGYATFDGATITGATYKEEDNTITINLSSAVKTFSITMPKQIRPNLVKLQSVA